MKKVIQSKVTTWLRGLVWAAMIAGCAWASGQSYAPSQGSYAAGAGQYQAMAAHYANLSAHYNAATLGAAEDGGITAAEGAQNAQALPKDDLFAGTEVFAKGASDITEITMDPDTLDLVGGPDEHKAHNMVLNVVRTYTYDKPGMYNMADVDAIRNKLNTGDWHCSVHVRDLKNGTGSDVCNKRRTDGLKESAIIEVEPKVLTFIHTIRRGNGPGSSELGFFPMLPGLSPLTMMAMTNSEALADMQIGLNGLPMMLNLRPDFMIKMNHLQDHLKTIKVKPIDPKQMEDLQKQMNDIDKDLNKDLNKGLYKHHEPARPAPPAGPSPVSPLP